MIRDADPTLFRVVLACRHTGLSNFLDCYDEFLVPSTTLLLKALLVLDTTFAFGVQLQHTVEELRSAILIKLPLKPKFWFRYRYETHYSLIDETHAGRSNEQP